MLLLILRDFRIPQIPKGRLQGKCLIPGQKLSQPSLSLHVLTIHDPHCITAPLACLPAWLCCDVEEEAVVLPLCPSNGVHHCSKCGPQLASCSLHSSLRADRIEAQDNNTSGEHAGYLDRSTKTCPGTARDGIMEGAQTPVLLI